MSPGPPSHYPRLRNFNDRLLLDFSVLLLPTWIRFLTSWKLQRRIPLVRNGGALRWTRWFLIGLQIEETIYDSSSGVVLMLAETKATLRLDDWLLQEKIQKNPGFRGLEFEVLSNGKIFLRIEKLFRFLSSKSHKMIIEFWRKSILIYTSSAKLLVTIF